MVSSLQQAEANKPGTAPGTAQSTGAGSLVCFLEPADNNSDIARSIMASDAEEKRAQSPSRKSTETTVTSDINPRRSPRSSGISSNNNTDERDNVDSATRRRGSRSASPKAQPSQSDKTVTKTNTTPSKSRSRSRSRRKPTVRPIIPSSPQEPLSAYQLYKLEIYDQLEQEHPKLSPSQLETKLKQKWIHIKNRDYYLEMEKEDKLRYEMELHQYNSLLDAATREIPLLEETKPSVELVVAKGVKEVSVSTTATSARPNVRTQGIQATESNSGNNGEASAGPTSNLQHLWKPSQFKNTKRSEILEKHRKLRRQKLAARRKGILFDDKTEISETDLAVNSDHWEIERILGKREYFQEDEFLVRWKGKDPSWDSWETIQGVEKLLGSIRLQNFWEQLRIFCEQEEVRKELMELGAKEMGLDKWGEAFSLVEDLEEIPLKAPTREVEPAESGPLQPDLAGAGADTDIAMPASNFNEQEVTNHTDSAEEEKRATEMTEMELDMEPKSSHAETTPASGMTHRQAALDTQPEINSPPDLYTQPLETTTITTMTLATGRIPDTAGSPIETDAPNPPGAEGATDNTSETETETETENTTEPTSGSASTENTKERPLRTLAMATLGHGVSEWSEESAKTSSASTARNGGTAPTKNADAAVPAMIEAKARPTNAQEVEVIMIDDEDETEDDHTPTIQNTSAVIAEVVTPPGQESTPTGSMEGQSTESQTPTMDDTDNILLAEVPRVSRWHLPKEPVLNVVLPKHRKRKRLDDDSSTLFQVPSAHDMNMREVRRVNVDDIDAKTIVTEAREKGEPIVLTHLLGHPQFATRWLKRWNGQNRDSDDEEFFVDGDPHGHQHEELLDLSLPHELDIVRMIEDIGEESVPILKKNYSENKPIVKETHAANFLRKCWPRNGREPTIKGLYLHQWQFPRSETAASKLCGNGNCTTIPNGIVGEDLLQFWLDGKDNPYQYIFMGGADTFSKLHKDPGGLDITIAPIVGEKECVMVHRLDESYLYGMKSKLDKVNLDKYPMTAHARVWKTVVKPGELLWMPAGTFHQCRNVTPCLSYHRLHLDTVNLQLFFNSLFVGDATEIEHDEVIWNCTIELTERIEKFLEGYRQRPTEPVPEHIAETAATISYLRPLCREIAVAFDDSCKQIHLRPGNKLFRSKQAVNSRCWPQLVHDIDLTLHDFNHRKWEKVPEYETQREKPALKPPVMEDPREIQKGLDLLQDTRTKEGCPTGTCALQKLYEKLSVIQPFQEGVVISDSIQLKSNDVVIFRIGEKQCTGRIVKIEDQLKTVYLAYSRLPSYYHEYVPVDSVASDHSATPLRKKQMVSSAIGGKGKPVNATVQSLKVATFYLVRFSMDTKSAKLQRWLSRDLIISKEN